jgi:hypothetical protein
VAPPPPEPPPPSHAAVPITWPVAGAAAALVVLALGVGVLIGNSTSKAPKVSQATPQVVTVAGGGTTGASGAAAQDASSGAAAKHHKSSKSSHAKAASDKGSVTVDKQQLNNLDNLSPQQYQKQSSKLPDTIKTQGKAAPIDKSKPVGGGSGSQTFK